MELFDIEEDCDYGGGVEDSILGRCGEYGENLGGDGGVGFGLGKGSGAGYEHGYGDLNDPFFPMPIPIPAALNTIKEDVEISLSFPTTPAAHTTPPSPNPNTCSVCGTSAPGPKAVLIPCAHPLCSACLTSALNIVGEKDMECCVCKKGVKDFRLVGGGVEGGSGDGKGEKDGTLEGEFEFFEDVRASSSPPPAVKSITGGEIAEDAVLRIDNVPWVRFSPPHLKVIHFTN